MKARTRILIGLFALAGLAIGACTSQPTAPAVSAARSEAAMDSIPKLPSGGGGNTAQGDSIGRGGGVGSGGT